MRGTAREYVHARIPVRAQRADLRNRSRGSLSLLSSPHRGAAEPAVFICGESVESMYISPFVDRQNRASGKLLMYSRANIMFPDK